MGTKMAAACATSRRDLRSNSELSGSPRRSSITTTGIPSTSNASMMSTTLGCSRAAAARASRNNRSRKAGFTSSGRMIFKATRRPVTLLVAL